MIQIDIRSQKLKLDQTRILEMLNYQPRAAVHQNTAINLSTMLAE